MAANTLSIVDFALAVRLDKVNDGAVRPNMAVKTGISLILAAKRLIQSRMVSGLGLRLPQSRMGLFPKWPQGEFKLKK